MDKKQYTKYETRRTARPRSERLRALGAAGTAAVSSSGGVSALRSALDAHVANAAVHVTAAEREAWNLVASLFELVNLGTDDSPLNAIKAKYGLFTESFLSAHGSDPLAGSAGGAGLDEEALWDILGTSGTEKIDISHIPSLSLTDVTGLEEALDGKLSGITGQMVKDALGYTPYDAAAIGSASVAYAASSGTAGKVAHALTVKHDGGSSSASAKTYNGSAAVTVTIPTTLPASDVYAWAKAATKPSYTWGEIGGKPTEFTPAEHTHVKADITDFPTSWAWSAITGKPSTLAGYGITDGVNSVTASGGLSASVSGHKLTVGVASGYAVPTSAQIGAWNAVAALFGVDADGNVYVKDGKGFYGMSFVSSRGSDAEAGQGGGTGVDMDAVWDALAAGTTEKINVSHLSATDLASLLTGAGYKLTDNDTTYTLTKSGSTITLTGSNGSKTSVTDSNTTYTLGSFGITATAAEINKLDGLATTAAELGYVHGVTSNIQTQLNAKANTSALSAYLPLAGGTMTGDIIIPSARATATSPTVPAAMTFNSMESLTDVENYRSFIGSASVGGTWYSVISARHRNGNGDGNEYGIYLTSRFGLTGGLTLRKQYAGDWGDEMALLDSSNYTSYAVSLTGAQTVSGAKTFSSPVTAPALTYGRNYRTRCDSVGWYRCFTFSINNAESPTAILHVCRNYNTADGESYVFALSVGYNGKVSVTQLSGIAAVRFITKIRVAYVNSSTAYVDFYYSQLWTGGNEVCVASSGFGISQAPAPVNDTTSNFYEFETADGCKSDKGFTGALSGNAATATKLATARTLWGKSFDGSGNVSGDMTGVGSITMTGSLSLTRTSSGVGLLVDNVLRSISWTVDTSGGWSRSLKATDPTGSTTLINVAGVYGAAQTPSYVYMGGTSFANAPFVVTADGNVGIGTTSPSYKLSVVGTANFTGRVFAQNGVTIGSTDDIGWYLNGSRITAGTQVAQGVNVGSLLVSNVWADYTKVPANGIYAKGGVLTDGYLQVGSGRLRWDAANNALYVEKSDGTACGLYSKGYMSSRGSDPEAGSSGSGLDEDAMWDALAASGSEVIDPSHIPALSQLSGALTNAQLVNDSISIAGVAVALGGSVSTAQIASALTTAGYKLTDSNTTYTLTKSGSTITLTGSDGRKTSVTDTVYTLPKATVSALGGIKAAGVRTSAITTTQGGTTSGRYYGVELDSNGKAFVNVPWVNTTYSLSSFGITATAAEINKLDGLATTAKELGYVHGVTSNIQTQLNAKANTSALSAYLPLAGGTMTGDIIIPSARATATSPTVPAAMTFNSMESLTDVENYRSFIGSASVGGTWYSVISARHRNGNGDGNEYGIYLTSRFGLTGGLTLRKQYAGDWGDEMALLDSSNYTSYAVSLTGAQTVSGAKTFSSPVTAPALTYGRNYRTRCDSVGWYRCFTFSINNAESPTAILHVCRNYNTADGESYVFALSVGYNGKVSVTQLSGIAAVRFITKIRVAYVNSSTAYVDFYYSQLWTGGNEVCVASSGFGISQAPAPVNDTTSNFYEFETADGCKSDKGFTGALSGNAATATKLATARTLWGKSFDGSGNVSGDMTGVGSITMTGSLSLTRTSSGVGLLVDNVLRSISWTVDTSGGWSRSLKATDPTGSTTLINVAGVYGAAQTPSYVYMGGTSFANAPFVVTADGNVGIGTTSPSYKLSVVGTANFTGRVFAQNGVTIGSTDDIGWYLNGSRITAGTQVAQGVNVGSLLVSNVWADYTKVPANGIYAKGGVLTDGYLQVGSGRLRWDAANNALYVEKSDGTACGLYSKGYMSARGSDPEAATGGSSELVPVVTLSKLTVGTNVSISVLANAGLTNDVLEKMRDGAVGRIKAVFSDGSTEIWPVLHASENFISFGYDTVAGGYMDTMDIYEITIPSKTSVIRVEHFER